MSIDRTAVLDAVASQLKERIQASLDELQALQAGNADNSKSTAGDKHDTERAMVHMEMENLSKRLDHERRLLHELEQLTKQPTSAEKVSSGSIITTDRGVFLIGAAFGRMQVKGQFITGISIQSPLGKQCINKKTGDSIEVNGNIFTVLSIA